MFMFSKKFLIRLKLNPLPQYRIAQKAGLHPTTLSQLVNGIVTVKENDPRLLKVAQVLGLKREEVFDPVD